MVRVEVADGIAECFEQMPSFVADHLKGLNDCVGEVVVGRGVGGWRIGGEVLEDLACFIVRAPVMDREVSDGGGGLGADLDGGVVEGDGGEVSESRIEASLNDLDAVQAGLCFGVARGGAQSAEELRGVGDDIGLRCFSEMVEEGGNGFQSFVGAVCKQDVQQISLSRFGDMRHRVDDGLVGGDVAAAKKVLINGQGRIHGVAHLMYFETLRRGLSAAGMVRLSLKSSGSDKNRRRDDWDRGPQRIKVIRVDFVPGKEGAWPERGDSRGGRSATFVRGRRDRRTGRESLARRTSHAWRFRGGLVRGNERRLARRFRGSGFRIRPGGGDGNNRRPARVARSR